jgi:hypothetical protein
MSIVHPEEYNVSMLLLDSWIRQAVFHEGTIKVTDLHGWYILVDKGDYYVHKYGHTERRHISTKEYLVEIVRERIYRTKGFERNGYSYNFSRGRWTRYKLDDQ